MHAHLCCIFLIVDLLKPGDIFSGVASYQSCVSAPDHQVALVVSASEGNVFSGSVVSYVGNQIKSWNVGGFFYIPGRKLVIAPEEYGKNALSLLCSHNQETGTGASCQILTDYMTKSCGSASISRDKTSKISLPHSACLLLYEPESEAEFSFC